MVAEGRMDCVCLNEEGGGAVHQSRICRAGEFHLSARVRASRCMRTIGNDMDD